MLREREFSGGPLVMTLLLLLKPRVQSPVGRQDSVSCAVQPGKKQK